MVSISVVMPVFNRADTVRSAIDSVLAQEFADFELVIVDDGSTDGTVNVVKSVVDARIRLFVQPENRGGNAARNRGIREAQGSIISFLDSDDLFLKHKLNRIAAYFAVHPGIDALIDSFELQYPIEKGTGTVKRINPELATSSEVEKAIFARNLFKATPAVSARKHALVKVGLFDETLKRRQDMDLVLRLAQHCEIRSISEVLWTKRWTQGAISSKRDTFMTALLEICARHPRYLTVPEYRRGLARDFARHVFRLVARGEFMLLARELQKFQSAYGAGESASLFAQGTIEILRRTMLKD
jgi:glycosyltransferase involved in cell wall biosynthesis